METYLLDKATVILLSIARIPIGKRTPAQVEMYSLLVEFVKG